jgi:hypothetical protein
MKEIPELLKTTASQLAQLLISENPDRDLQKTIIQKLSFENVTPFQPANYTDQSPIPPVRKRIGIWKPVETGARKYFVRDSSMAGDWRLWATRHTLYPKGNSKRVVLLGESVARGYFYDPFYNPAIELQTLLRSVEGLGEMEVIDLAKSGLNFTELMDVSVSCLDLEPDVILIFAGNNWSAGLYDAVNFSAEEMQEMTDMLRANRFSVYRSKLEEKIKASISLLMAHLAELGKSKKTEIVFIIPEFNLLDWESSAMERVTLNLFGDRQAAWITTRDEALESFAAEELNTAGEKAERLITLDGTNPLGYELLARCEWEKGNYERARPLYEMARDVVIFGKVMNYSPRCFSFSRKAILDGALEYGFKVVDLPGVFSDYLSGGLPGKELFLDYCHLTAEGIRVAMEATARCLLPLLNEKAEAGYYRSETGPDPDVQAMAHIFAAVHNSRYGQSREVLEHHCRAAIEESDVALKFMPLYASLATRKVDTVLCRSYEQVVMGNLADQYLKGTGLLHPPDRKPMDLDLVDCMAEVLKDRGRDIGDKIKNLRQKEHGIGKEETDLLAFYYHTFSNYKLFGSDNGHFKALDNASLFVLISDGEAPITLKLVCRTRARPDSPACIIVNGREISQFDTDKMWKTHLIEIPVNALVKGVNQLFVLWPSPELVCRKPAGNSFAGIKNGFPAKLYEELYPIFGEIHQFTASIK